MTATVDEGWITAVEAAERLGVTKRHILRYIERGKLPARRVVSGPYPNGYFVVNEADLEKVAPGRKPTALTDEFLRGVAKLYRKAVANGDSPRPFIAEEYGRSKNTVDLWILKARKRGLLGDWDVEKRH